MNVIDKIQVLHGEVVQIQYRKKILKLIPYTHRGWWMSFHDEGTHWFVLLTNNRNSHCRAWGSCSIGVEFRKDTGKRNVTSGIFAQTGAWKSAISLGTVEDEAEAIQIFDDIRVAIEKTYDFLYKN